MALLRILKPRSQASTRSYKATIHTVYSGSNILTIVVSSAVGFGVLSLEPNLVDALAKSKDLVTYIPSTFSSVWSKEDYADLALGGFLKFQTSGWDRAKEKGVRITAAFVGIFDIYMFKYGCGSFQMQKEDILADSGI